MFTNLNNSIFSLVNLLNNFGYFEVLPLKNGNYKVTEWWSPSGDGWDNEYFLIVKGNSDEVRKELDSILRKRIKGKRDEIKFSLDWRKDPHFADTCNNQAHVEAEIEKWEKYLKEFEEKWRDFI